MSMTPRTPRSRTSSRSPTPGPKSHLIVPHALKSTRSLTNLNIHASGSNNTSISPSPPHVLDSAASSIANVDISEGILIEDDNSVADIVEVDGGNVMGVMESTAGGDQSKQNLREHLRN